MPTNTIMNTPVGDFAEIAHKGVVEYMGKNDVLKIGGVRHTKASLANKLEKMMKPFIAVTAARQALEDAIVARDKTVPEVQAFAKDFAAAIRSEYGTSAEVLNRFGVRLPKPRRELTLDEKVVKSAKAQETRKLRGTQGKRQRSKVKAEGPREVSVAAPVAAQPATPTPPAAPKAAPVSNGAVNVVVAPAPVDAALAKPVQANGVEH